MFKNVIIRRGKGYKHTGQVINKGLPTGKTDGLETLARDGDKPQLLYSYVVVPIADDTNDCSKS